MINNKPVEVEGDPESPINRGELCLKGIHSLEYLYSSHRLRHPLKRTGKRGEGKWQQISWDEALDTIASELQNVKTNYGAESVGLLHGSAKGYQNTWLHRFGHAFGTPNIAAQGHVCHQPRTFASRITYGYAPQPDVDHLPACIVAWGLNAAETNLTVHQVSQKAIKSSMTKLIVINPMNIGIVGNADLWLRIRPGSDLALALGMLHVIINEGLYDKVFVDKWAVGFKELEAHIQDYPPERVEALTWIEVDSIKKAARLYAKNKPACIQWGNALDHNINSFQTGRAISILAAITGNLGIPGGEVEWTPPPIVGWSSPDLELFTTLEPAIWQKRLDAELELLPIFRYILPQSIARAILEGRPYPIHAAYILGCNSLLTHANALEMYEAFKKVGFLAVAEMFMTPTAALADIVLPVASHFEVDSIVTSPNSTTVAAQIQQKVTAVDECRSDYQIFSALAYKLGLGKYFWESEEQCLDSILAPAGITFNEFREIGVLRGNKHYRKYERDGFATPSCKVELYSSQLMECGLDPLPVYHEAIESPDSILELDNEYPFILTSWKPVTYRHSRLRQISSLRGIYPEPITFIHPKPAGELGIQDGDRIYIETKCGKITQKAMLSADIDPRIVVVDYGWWFPEDGATEMFGWEKSNINVLTNSKPPYSREIGSTNLRGINCKIYKR
jgi:anaerobic selenocysteine-containing dehydrogenase